MRTLGRDSQLLQFRLDVGELNEDGLVGYTLVIEHEANSPNGG